jgi:hypothetical protein
MNALDLALKRVKLIKVAGTHGGEQVIGGQ